MPGDASSASAMPSPRTSGGWSLPAASCSTPCFIPVRRCAGFASPSPKSTSPECYRSSSSWCRASSSAWCSPCRATTRCSASAPRSPLACWWRCRSYASWGPGGSLGGVVALSLVRGRGPVGAGLLFGSRAGSAITAEIGLMKATEQISAMEMMAVDPIARVVAPRFWGGVLSMPLLAALFSAMGVFGGYLIGVQLIGVDAGAFWSQMQAAVDLRNDILNGVIKSVVFGFAVTWIAVFEGYDAPPTAEGVSRATTRTVVTSSLAILALDFVLTALMFTGGTHQ